ncbi:hypothetical protein SCL_1917 [Sulfuricaulis limicola]|uniref:Uncharacterized protein n=2 Tax=Sulfuricaulis limicola TaxID=1620215 RepID=A0A1B4XHD9_9GAMM|nr:hypothetical protein SCL_1917 [Sulfuricaulis limicola]
MSVDYYKPEAPGGQAISKACGAINAPKNIWRHEMDRVTLEATVGEDALDKPPGEFMLRLFVPVGMEVSLQSKKVSMRTVTNPKHQNLEFMKLHLFRGTFKKELEKLESTVFKGDTEDEFGLFEGRWTSPKFMDTGSSNLVHRLELGR